jgi:hypothetical protein
MTPTAQQARQIAEQAIEKEKELQLTCWKVENGRRHFDPEHYNKEIAAYLTRLDAQPDKVLEEEAVFTIDDVREWVRQINNKELMYSKLAEILCEKAGASRKGFDAPTAGDSVTFDKSDWERAKQSIGNLNYQGLINIDDLVKIIAQLEDKVGYPAPPTATAEQFTNEK